MAASFASRLLRIKGRPSAGSVRSKLPRERKLSGITGATDLAMARKFSSLAPEWWDYTTIDDEIIAAAAALTPESMLKLSRPGFKILFYDTLEEFYLAEALEYINAWRQSTPDNPVGICGPIGPTEQLPLVARIVNALGLSLKSGHFWGMDEWFLDGKEAPATHPLSFEKADREMCFNRIDKKLVMPDA